MISVQPSIGSTIWVFSIGYALWVLDVLSCVYWHRLYQTDHSTLWWLVIGVYRLTLYQECHRAVLCFGPVIVPLYCSELFSILENKLIGYADDSTLMTVVPSPGIRVTVSESLIRDLGRVVSGVTFGG